ncbi:hypothetical protein CERZMDRAFT_98362 [Cercospora zeae-maydis SCOH1-5]|uniref:Uncharacterized protein n=1 Tax=Cercospora zeae-maydis SCOH1-5 TaxID=717836 RepID=A0A6A6FDK8_9PEZI|nr:hypothetical protein CERZMDRAFT_98362 [Cercospora zeae-maydis SCOH1-5]
MKPELVSYTKSLIEHMIQAASFTSSRIAGPNRPDGITFWLKPNRPNGITSHCFNISEDIRNAMGSDGGAMASSVASSAVAEISATPTVRIVDTPTTGATHGQDIQSEASADPTSPTLKNWRRARCWLGCALPVGRRGIYWDEDENEKVAKHCRE